MLATSLTLFLVRAAELLQVFECQTWPRLHLRLWKCILKMIVFAIGAGLPREVEMMTLFDLDPSIDWG